MENKYSELAEYPVLQTLFIMADETGNKRLHNRIGKLVNEYNIRIKSVLSSNMDQSAKKYFLYLLKDDYSKKQTYRISFPDIKFTSYFRNYANSKFKNSLKLI